MRRPVWRRTGAGVLAHFDLMADSSRLRERLDWRPEHDDLDDIVTTALAWERKLRFCRGS